MPITIRELGAWKAEGKRFAMLTAYDYPTARLLAEAEGPVLLVGDTLADNVLGYPNTIPVTMTEMLHHARAVARGAPEQLLVGDLPFGTYQRSCGDAIDNSVEYLKAGMHAIKLEGGAWVVETVSRLTQRGIPVMGHLGLTPQSVNAFGGLKVQARSARDRERLVADAHALEDAGAFAVVLEGIPRDLAAQVTSELAIPTIGIGAGPDCDAQVLVIHDLLGITGHLRGAVPKFVKPYADLGDGLVRARRDYADDVR